MKANKLAVILLGSVLGTGSVEAKAEQMPFFENVDNQSVVSKDWVIGGQKIGYNGGLNSNWDYSHSPINDNKGIEMKVSGPSNGVSYGAGAWAQTKIDFNNEHDWLINFSFQVDRKEPDANWIFIQITDGYTDPNGMLYWFNKDIPGTVDLAYNKALGFNGQDTHFLALNGNASPWPDNIANWSIEIDKSGIARLYNEPNKKGNMISEKTLDFNHPWHLRFMGYDGNSAGYGPGNMSFNVYQVSANHVPEPSSLVLLASAGIGTLGYLGLNKKTKN